MSATGAGSPTNGNGLSQRELLLELRAGQTEVLAKLETLSLRQAIHEALPIHPGASKVLDEISCEQQKMADQQDALRGWQNKVLGAIALAVVVLPILTGLILHLVSS